MEIFGPFDFENPWDLFGNAIGMLLPMMVMSVGIVTGFLAGTVMLPSLLMLGLGWESAGKTFLFLLLLLVPVVPLTLWLMVEVSSSLSTRDSVWVLTWVGAVVVGGLTPAAARILTLEGGVLPATRERETE